MANKLFSFFKQGGNTYEVKDAQARADIATLSTSLGDISSASSVTGNDAFSKIETLSNNKVTKESVITVPAGSSISVTLTRDSVYLLAGSSNVHRICTVITTNGNDVSNFTDLITAQTVSYTKVGLTVTIANANTQYGVKVNLVELFS